jgi:hypothetical protein
VALNNLIVITPAKASVLTFTGMQLPTAGSSSVIGKPGTSTGTHAAEVGTINLSVNGPGPSLSISEAWINAVSTSQFFANPLQGATTVEPNSSISFPFTVSVAPAASLSKNASLK